MSEFKHCDKLKANPLMCLIIGSTGSGKTWLLFQLLTRENILDFEKLVIYTTTPKQPYFQFLKHGFEQGLSKTMINSLFEIYEAQNGLIDSEQIPDMITEASLSNKNIGTRVEVLLTDKMDDLTTSLMTPNGRACSTSKRPKTLVIFDDCVTNLDQQAQCEIFTMGRHNNCHCIYLSQSFYGLDKRFIRKNANVFILFSQPQRSLTAILQDIDHGMKSEEFKQLAEHVWYDPQMYGYILINTRKPRDKRCLTDIFSN